MQGGLDAVSRGKFGPSCETLQSRFRLRSKNLQDFSNSYSGADDMTLAARARAVMKASAVLRTLRRGSACPWAVAGNNNDDIEAVGKVVSSIIANNPCAPAAIAELQLLDTPGEEGAAPLARAMSILMSDTCEYQDQGQESNESNEMADDDDVEVEELVQDGVEEMMESEDTKSSLVEQQETQRTQSVAYLTLGCGFAGLWIVGFVGVLFGGILVCVTQWLGHNPQWDAKFMTVFWPGAIGGVIGGVRGVAICGEYFHGVVSNLTSDQSGLVLEQ